MSFDTNDNDQPMDSEASRSNNQAFYEDYESDISSSYTDDSNEASGSEHPGEDRETREHRPRDDDRHGSAYWNNHRFYNNGTFDSTTRDYNQGEHATAEYYPRRPRPLCSSSADRARDYIRLRSQHDSPSEFLQTPADSPRKWGSRQYDAPETSSPNPFQPRPYSQYYVPWTTGSYPYHTHYHQGYTAAYIGDREMGNGRYVSHTQPRASETNTPSAGGNGINAFAGNYGDGGNMKEEVKSSARETHNLQETYGMLESMGLSKRLPLTDAPDVAIAPSAEASAWTKQKTYLEDSATTELHVIQKAELSTYVGNEVKVTLTCTNPSMGQEIRTPEQPESMRWLHIQRESLRLDVLEKLVLACPFVPPNLRPVAIRVLYDISGRTSSHLDKATPVEPGTIVRYTGHSAGNGGDSAIDTDAVTFYSVPYLLMNDFEPDAVKQDCQSGEPLLHAYYGHGPGNNREPSQVVQKLSIAPGREVLRVFHLWCLTIGSDILVTFGNVTSQYLRGKLVGLAEQDLPKYQPRVVRLIDPNNSWHDIRVRSDYNYVDVLRHAVTLVSPYKNPQLQDYELLDFHRDLITPQKWLDIMSSPMSPFPVIRLAPKPSPSVPAAPPKRPSVPEPPSKRPSVSVPPPRQYSSSYSSGWKVPDAKTCETQDNYEGETQNDGIERESHRPSLPIVPYRGPHAGLGNGTNEPSGHHISERKRRSTKGIPAPSEIASAPLRLIVPSPHTNFDGAGTDPQAPLPGLGSAPRIHPTIPPDRSLTRYSRGSSHSQEPKSTALLSSENSLAMMEIRPSARQRINGSLPIREPVFSNHGEGYYQEPMELENKDLVRWAGEPTADRTTRMVNPKAGVEELPTSQTGALVLWEEDGDKGGPSPHRETAFATRNKIIVDPSYGVRMPEVVSANYVFEDAAAGTQGSPPTSFPPPHLSHQDMPGEEYTGAATLSPQFNIDTYFSDRSNGDDGRPPPLRQRHVRFTRSVQGADTEDESVSEYGKSSASPVPFFKWRLEAESKPRTREQVDTDLRIVLDHVNREMSNGKSRRTYLEIFRCSKKELQCRHAIDKSLGYRRTTAELDREQQRAQKGEAITGRERMPETTPWQLYPITTGVPNAMMNSVLKNHSISQDGLTSEDIVQASKDDGKNQTDGTSKLGDDLNQSPIAPSNAKGRTGRPNLGLMGELLKTTERVVWAFLGEGGRDSVHESHAVCKALWGSMDVIGRQIMWAGLRSRTQQGTTAKYAIRSFDHAQAILGDDARATNRRLSWTNCPACGIGTQYPTAGEALKHISEVHIDPSRNELHTFEDPRFCWIDPLRETTDDDLRAWPGYLAVQSFMQSVKGISDHSRELLYLVTRPSTPSDEDGSTASSLPTTLTSAFCNILSSYVLLATRLSFINRVEYATDSNQRSSIDCEIRSLEILIGSSFKKASALLEKAKPEIILLYCTHLKSDFLRVRSADMHLLPVSILFNVQVFDLPGDRSDDVMRIYRYYLTRLRLHASRRPQRRVFLDIQNFQEELDALRSTTEIQRAVAAKYINLMYPGSFRVTSTARVESYYAEHEIWQKLEQVLQDRSDELDSLDEQSRRLKDDVKQAIEILDENHGKAIRVFTVVTLFFLPLSFVSSFMGMNTTDIRDTEHDQKLFWSAGVPVTACVIALAFTYAYKGDELSDWIRNTLRPRGRFQWPKGNTNQSNMSAGREFSPALYWQSQPSRPNLDSERHMTWASQASR